MILVFMTPSVEGAGNPPTSRRDAILAAFYLIGSIAGGIGITVAAAVAGSALEQIAPEPIEPFLFGGVLALAITIAFLQARNSFGFLPQRHQQVPRRWLRWRSMPSVALAYGAMIGFAVLTHMAYVSMYLVLISAAVLPLKFAVVLGLLYGTARAFNVIVAAGRARLSPVSLSMWRHLTAALCAASALVVIGLVL